MKMVPFLLLVFMKNGFSMKFDNPYCPGVQVSLCTSVPMSQCTLDQHVEIPESCRIKRGVLVSWCPSNLRGGGQEPSMI